MVRLSCCSDVDAKLVVSGVIDATCSAGGDFVAVPMSGGLQISKRGLRHMIDDVIHWRFLL